MTQTQIKTQWRRVVLYALFLALLTSIPYWLAWRAAGADHVFGGFLFGADDGNSYIAKMRLGAQGHWDFYLFYTAEEHQSAGLLFLPYILPGQIVGLFINEADPALTPTLIGVFHLMRVGFGVLLILVLYRFIAAFLRSERARLLVLVLATLGGGFGWMLIFAGEIPPEFFIPEGFSFLILLGLPHLALARAALLGGLLLLVTCLDKRYEARLTPTNALLHAVLAGLLWLIVGLAVPFYLIILYAILSAWVLALWIRTRVFPARTFIHAGIAGGVTLPLCLYNVVVFSTNPAFAQFSAQNLLPSPPPLHYALAYLPLTVLALMGVRWAWARARIDGRYALLIGWPVIVPLLVYVPVNVQRRMAEAVIVPLSILAAGGVTHVARRLKTPRTAWRRVAMLALLATLPTTLFLYVGSLFSTARIEPPLFHPTAEIAAFNWLNQHASPGDVVLSAFATGNRIPAYTNLRVYVGHGPESLFAVPKTRETERFFSGDMDAAARAALYDTMRIRYVFYGAAERALSPNPDAPEWAEGLSRVYDQSGYAIYEVPTGS